MSNFTQEDHDWFERVQKMEYRYKIVIDNDSVWVDDILEGTCVYTFNSYGYEFIHALLKDMGINVSFC